MNIDNDNDHSSSQLFVHKALTSLEGQSAAPSLFGEKFVWCRNNLSKYASSDLVPFQMKWACTCWQKEMWLHARAGPCVRAVCG